MKKVLSGVLILLVLASFLIVFIPVYLIRPFAPQTASDLDVSYSLRSASPLLTLAALVLGLLCALPLWKSASEPASQIRPRRCRSLADRTGNSGAAKPF